MYVGILQIELHLPGAQSLKNKRRVVNSMIKRLQNKFNIAIAEVGSHDKWQLAKIGISAVGNNSVQIEKLLAQVVNLIEESQGNYQLVSSEIEIISIK